MKKKCNSGFSLVELIIVIAIMAILVGVMTPILLKNIEKSRVSRDVQMCDTVHRALEVAMADPDVVKDPKSQQMIADMMNPGGRMNHYYSGYGWLDSELASTVTEIVGFNPFDITLDQSNYIKSKKGTAPCFCTIGDPNSDHFAVYIAWTDRTAGKNPENYNGSYDGLEDSKVIYVK